MVILCQKEKCGGTIAHIKGKAVELIRSKSSERAHRVVIVSKDVSVLASCPRCFEMTSILVEDGNLNTEQLTTQEEKPSDETNEEQPGQPAGENAGAQ